MAHSDRKLVERTLAGDDSAFDELVSSYRTRIYYLALSKVHARETALDLAQDAFIQAYLSLKTLREPDKFASWLVGIASNLGLMYHRKASEIPISDCMIESLQAEKNGAVAMDSAVEDARNAINNLPEGTRSVAILYFVEEMKMREIAEILEISLPAVKSRVREARVRLQKEMIDMVKGSVKSDAPGDEFNRSLQHKLELGRWYREFADMVENGVNLMSTLHQLLSGDFSSDIREATQKLMDAVGSGSTMSDALADLPALTLPQTIGMVKAGEYGGILDWTTKFLADWIEIENSQRQLELVFWCRAVGSIIVAGVDIRSALDVSFDITRSKDYKHAVRALADAATNNQPLDPVFDKYSDVFPPIVRVSVLAGAKANVLGYALQWAANELYSTASTRLYIRDLPVPISIAEWTKAFTQATSEYLRSYLPEERSAAVTILGRLEAEDYLKGIIKCLRDEDAAVRKAAIQALVNMKCKSAEAELVESTKDRNMMVRRAAVYAIVDLDFHDAAQAVADMMTDPEQRVANDAIKALEQMGEMEVLTRQATALLSSEYDMARVRAVHVLRDHPTPIAAEVLIAALNDSVSNVCFTAAYALADLGRKEAVPVLLKALEYPWMGYFQRNAASALEKLGAVEAVPNIRRAIAEGRLDESYGEVSGRLEAQK